MGMTISVVIPTIDGREHLLNQTCEAYEATHDDLEFVVVSNHPTCGEGWNSGARAASGDYLLLGTDDLVPHSGWAEAAIAAADVGVYPAPWIVNVDGSTECCGTLGSGLLLGEQARDGLPVNSSPIPFMWRESWPFVGPSISAHCYADDYLAYRARLAGLRVEVRRLFKFTHLDGQLGKRTVAARAMQDRQRFAEAVVSL